MVNNFLQENALEIGNCRSQCYDNASNMRGIYSSVQSRFRQVNKFAEWVPCTGHSLNLVGSTTAECCLYAVKYFGILQSIRFCLLPLRGGATFLKIWKIECMLCKVYLRLGGLVAVMHQMHWQKTTPKLEKRYWILQNRKYSLLWRQMKPDH